MLIKNVCSMIVILTMMTYLINRLIKYDIIYIYSIILGMGIGVISLTIRAIVFVVKCRITERSSKTKFQKIFEKITDESVQEYFLKCKYQLKKKDGTYCLVICKTEIIIDEQANFTEPFISEIRDAFDKKEFIYCLKEYNEEDIKNNCMRELKEIANKRTKMLREGHDAVYRLFNEREEEIKNMLMVK